VLVPPLNAIDWLAFWIVNDRATDGAAS